MASNKKIFIIAGEASGDLYGAKLASQLLEKNSDLKIFGMGGDLMRNAHVDLVVDAKDLAVIGLIDVLKNFGKIRDAFNKIKKAIIQEKPDLIILIDYPGFNLRLAKVAKKANVKVLYYISPQIWAWRYNRIKKIKRDVDHMAVILPFEAEIYRKENVPVTFVGHPLLDIVKPTMSKIEAQKTFGFKPEDRIVGLMPGSRKSEINYLLPTMLKAAEIIKESFPEIQFILPLASTLHECDLNEYLDKSTIAIKIIKNNSYNAMQICDAIIAASGTATLEITILGIPLVIVFKTAPLNAFLGRRLIKVKFFGLANLIAEKEIIPELLQEDVTAENIADKMKSILKDQFLQSKMIADFSVVKQKLSVPTKKDICDVVMGMLS